MVLWMGANKIKSTGSPPFFASPGYTQLALLTDFLVHPAIYGSLFTGYVIQSNPAISKSQGKWKKSSK